MANRKVIDRSMIEEFGAQINSNNFRNAIYRISDIIEESMMELSEKNSLINMQNVDIIPASNVFETEILDADLNLFITVKSAQIELNSIGPMEKKSRIIWNRITHAWKNRKGNTRRTRRKAAKLAKKKEKVLTKQDLAEIKEKPYTILSFKDDVFQYLADKLTEMTILYNYPSQIRILGREEFGCKINLFPAIKHTDGLKVWAFSKNKFIFVKPEEAKKLLNQKNKEINQENSKINQSTGKDYLYSTIRIFKNIYYSIYRAHDYDFIESLIYGCPNSLFINRTKTESNYNIFIKVLNYLTNSDISNYRSIYNQDKLMTEQHEISVFKIKSFLRDTNDHII